jgi:flagellar export protein FliJ
MAAWGRSAVFAFRLEPVLRARQRAEDEQVLALARALKRRAATLARLGALRQEATSCRQALAAAARDGATGALLSRLARDIQSLSAEDAATVSLLHAEDSQVQRARADLIEAARARKVLDRLRERQQDSHRQWLEASGRRQADDLTAAHHLWQGRGPGAEWAQR